MFKNEMLISGQIRPRRYIRCDVQLGNPVPVPAVQTEGVNGDRGSGRVGRTGEPSTNEDVVLVYGLRNTASQGRKVRPSMKDIFRRRYIRYSTNKSRFTFSGAYQSSVSEFGAQPAFALLCQTKWPTTFVRGSSIADLPGLLISSAAAISSITPSKGSRKGTPSRWEKGPGLGQRGTGSGRATRTRQSRLYLRCNSLWVYGSTPRARGLYHEYDPRRPPSPQILFVDL